MGIPRGRGAHAAYLTSVNNRDYLQLFLGRSWRMRRAGPVYFWCTFGVPWPAGWARLAACVPFCGAGCPVVASGRVYAPRTRSGPCACPSGRVRGATVCYQVGHLNTAIFPALFQIIKWPAILLSADMPGVKAKKQDAPGWATAARVRFTSIYLNFPQLCRAPRGHLSCQEGNTRAPMSFCRTFDVPRPLRLCCCLVARD